ncbi:dimethylsulfonioproprionate lyase family protein [uncultured Albimonas sp.]|uniref:dimethylsulfonioproprionate lyase family protein n=1 Tax=uncultured Albimonas sp. TaxID=1331701 RepID=UPI0030EB6F62
MTDDDRRTLGRTPDWGYLLRELQELHRASSAGGSARVRAHHDRVCGLLGELIEADAPLVPAAQGPEPEALAHLTRAIDRGVRQPSQEVIRAVRALRGTLAWHTEYDPLPEPMRGRFAQCEIAGPSGPVRSADVIVGLMLFAPGCRYPEHWHEEIDESYLFDPRF